MSRRTFAFLFLGSALGSPLLSLRGGASNTNAKKTLPKAIESAIEKDDMVTVRGAIESGMVDPKTCVSATGNAILHVAASHGSLRCVNFLLDDDLSPVDLKRFDGVTAAMFASQNGHRLCLAMLQQRGADVNAADHEGSTAIHFAARHGHANCVSLLKSCGAKLDAKRADGITALMCAAQSAQLECVQLLLSQDADASLTDNLGATALHFASRQGNGECVEALLKCQAARKLGAKFINARDKVGTAPLHLAADNGHSHCVAALLQAGAAADPKRQDGSTPTHRQGPCRVCSTPAHRRRRHQRAPHRRRDRGALCCSDGPRGVPGAADGQRCGCERATPRWLDASRSRLCQRAGRWWPPR